MPKRVDYDAMLGHRYGRWTVTEVDGFRLTGNVLCVCDCGSERVVRVGSLTSGASKSCGCYNREAVSARRTTHGLSDDPLYFTWHHMLDRTRPDYRQAKDYHGRGIKVCAAWHDLATFYTWVTENLGPCPYGYTLDRIDNDGNYEPGNVRWATRAQQNQNRRKTPVLSD